MRSFSFFRVLVVSLLFGAAQAAMAQNQVIYKAVKIYTADTSFSTVEAMVVENGMVLATGDAGVLQKAYPNAAMVSLGNKFVYPGLIDAHCHFLAYAKGLKECNLIGTKSSADVIKRLKKFDKTNERDWIVGRGWDQNDWKEQVYPTMEILDKAFPNKPVYLSRVDGHAVWINSAAVKALNFDVNQKVPGGEIPFQNGNFAGILIDNAVDLISNKVPAMDKAILDKAVMKAASNCYKVGLTTLDEAGLEIKDIQYLTDLQTTGKLDMRIYAMVSASENNFAWIAENGIQKTPQMHVGAVKFYMDGALGSRGALLKHDYCDRHGHRGLQLTDSRMFYNYANFLFTRGFQVCTHAIGDSANKIVLETYRKILPLGIDLKWRVEHAQITDPADFEFYKKSGIIPSVQPTHATSDAPWAISRICDTLIPGAYAYKSLFESAGILALGTDFPVEDISPIKTFYSAITRLDATGNLKEPFIPRQGITRQQALWGMTLWAAYANNEEKEKGSLEAGKFADFIVTDKDLMTVPENKIPSVKIKATYVGGTNMIKK
jgi:predicted amidohydrolase YtcJ